MQREDRVVAALQARHVCAWLEGDDLITVLFPGVVVCWRRDEYEGAGELARLAPAQETWSGYGLEEELLFRSAELREEAPPDEVAEAIIHAAIV